MREARPPRGIFAGLATLDVIHRVEAPPGSNQKVTAHAQFVAAGGPAANAAVTFAALGGEATLLTALGSGPIAATIAAELRDVGVRVVDIAPTLADDAPVSSVTVTESSGDRAVVGGDAAGIRVPAPDAAMIEAELAGAAVLLLDGHHPELARAVCLAAGRTPIVLDAGRWKPVMSDLIPRASDVVASADFRTPDTSTARATADHLVDSGVPVVVTTAGGDPVRWWSSAAHGEVTVPVVDTVDTLGAGDVFHGAYAFALALGADLEQRIAYAAEVAATRCAHVGPRSWLKAIASIALDRGDG